MKADQRKSLGLVLIETSNALNGHSYGRIFFNWNFNLAAWGFGQIFTANC